MPIRATQGGSSNWAIVCGSGGSGGGRGGPNAAPPISSARKILHKICPRRRSSRRPRLTRAGARALDLTIATSEVRVTKTSQTSRLTSAQQCAIDQVNTANWRGVAGLWARNASRETRAPSRLARNRATRPTRQNPSSARTLRGGSVCGPSPDPSRDVRLSAGLGWGGRDREQGASQEHAQAASDRPGETPHEPKCSPEFDPAQGFDIPR